MLCADVRSHRCCVIVSFFFAASDTLYANKRSETTRWSFSAGCLRVCFSGRQSGLSRPLSTRNRLTNTPVARVCLRRLRRTANRTRIVPHALPDHALIMCQSSSRQPPALASLSLRLDKVGGLIAPQIHVIAAHPTSPTGETHRAAHRLTPRGRPLPWCASVWPSLRLPRTTSVCALQPPSRFADVSGQGAPSGTGLPRRLRRQPAAHRHSPLQLLRLFAA